MKKPWLVAIRFLAVGAAVLVGVAPANAQKLENVYQQWNVFTLDQGGQRVCYIASAPSKEEGTFTNRGEPYLLVTHRSAKVDEVSLSAGYPFKGNSEVIVSIDGKQRAKLFTKDELAWAYSEKDDVELVQAMKKGGNLVAAGVSQKDTKSKDTYSLKGISSAYKRMKELCK